VLTRHEVRAGLTWIAPINSFITLIRLSLAFSKSWVICALIISCVHLQARWSTLMLRFETRELSGTANARTITPAKADQPRMLLIA